MKRFRHIPMAAAIVLLIGGCSDESAPEPEGALEDQNAALERARAVEDDLLEASDRQRERIEDDGG
jgi:PBP1b-binding outer membrane lipoprotein LpoB